MTNSAQTSVAKGAALMIAMRWTDRLIGLASTLILARLLVPDDFGIVAQASLIVALLGIFTDLGVHIALIQNKNAEQAHFDTAWTIRLIQYSCVAMLVFVLAPYAGDYFGDPRVVPVLQVMVATLLLAGLENIGVITFQKEMKFGRDFRFLFLKRIVGFVATVSLAFAWQSYWALVVGSICGRLAGLILSYTMHPMRPRLSLSRFSEIFSVSQWALVKGIGEYFNNNLDRLIIGGRENSGVVGAYTVANEISLMPASEILAPINRVLFPAFTQVKEDLAELKRMFLMAQGIQCLFAIPASVGLSLVAEDAVVVLLGEKWRVAGPFLEVLALAYVVQAIATSAGYVMVVMGRIRYIALIIWSQVALFVLVAFALIPQGAAIDIAYARLAATVSALFLTFWLLRKVLPNLRFREVINTIARPLIGVIVMAFAVHSIAEFFPASEIILLGAEVLVGAISYVVVIGLLWAFAGRPKGAETYVLGKTADVLSRFKSRSVDS